MANVIRLKRASGSDPAASDLVSGEPAVRTDTGELFFKKDDGSIAKVAGAGGGPDFKYLALRNAANNGAASFPNADFTLVTSGTTSAIVPTAANTLLVSVNGVIQKPNTGTSTPSSGFALSGSTIKFGANISAAPDFILYQESGGIGEPSDDTVSEVKLKVSNSPVNGYFLSAQSGNNGGLTWAAPVATSCTGNSATATALATARAINGVNFDGTAAITVTAAAGTLTGNTLNSSVVTSSLTSLGDLTSLTVTGDLVVDTSTLKVDSSNNRVGIGTASPSEPLHINSATTLNGLLISSTNNSTRATMELNGKDSSGNQVELRLGGFGDTSRGEIFTVTNHSLGFATNNAATQMVLNTSGNLGIGLTNPVTKLDVVGAGTFRVANSTSYQGAFNATNQVTTDFQIWVKNNNIALGPSTASDIHFVTQGNGNTRMIVQDNGKVGIGTTSPDSILDLSGSAPRITFNDTAGTDDIAKIFSTGGSLYLQQRDGTSHGQIIFRTENNSSASERMRIGSSGEVYIGTSNWPTGSMGKAAGRVMMGNEGSLTLWNETNSAGGGGTLKLACKEGSNATRVGFVNLVGGTENTSDRASFFKIQVSNSSGSGIERMRIASGGNVGISETNPQAKLHLRDDYDTQTVLLRLRNYKSGVNTKPGLTFEASTSSGQGANSRIEGLAGTDAGGSNSSNDSGMNFIVRHGGSGTERPVMELNSDGVIRHSAVYKQRPVDSTGANVFYRTVFGPSSIGPGNTGTFYITNGHAAGIVHLFVYRNSNSALNRGIAYGYHLRSTGQANLGSSIYDFSGTSGAPPFTFTQGNQGVNFTNSASYTVTVSITFELTGKVDG